MSFRSVQSITIMTTMDELAAVATEATREGGTYLRDEFERTNTTGSYTGPDVIAEVDHGAEERIVTVVREAFPDHALYTEESGERNASGYRWVVDPLDGTNNFTAGLPTFATVVTALDDRGPAVAAVYLPIVDDMYVARRGQGVTYNGEATSAGTDLAGEQATLGFVVGHEVKSDPEKLVLAGHLQNTLDVRTKRVIESWSPAVHWALLTRGLVQGMVAFHPDEEEQYAGELLAEESRASIREGDNVYVAAANDRILAELADITDPVI